MTYAFPSAHDRDTGALHFLKNAYIPEPISEM